MTSPDVDMRVRSIASRSAPTGSIRTLTRNTLIVNVGCAAFAVRRWHQPKPEPNDVFDAQKSVQLCGDTTLEPGEAIVARAAYDAYVAGLPGEAVTIWPRGRAGLPKGAMMLYKNIAASAR